MTKRIIYRMASRPQRKSGFQRLFEAAMWTAVIIILVTMFFSFIGPKALGW